jgi:spermidine synthase
MKRNALPYALMFLSGFAGLGYEMVWVRALSAGLGHEIVSVLAVMAAFFVGTAAGAWLLDRPMRVSCRPQRWYAALEMAIALWALVLTSLIPQIAPLGALLMGVQPSAFVQWGVTFLLPLVLLLPATLAMGAVLPAMDGITARLRGQASAVGGLYGANTLGAVAGTLAATFWIVPAVGFSRTQYLLALVNVICLVGVFALQPVAAGALLKPPDGQTVALNPPKRLLMTLFCTGLLGIGYEVMSVRIVSQVLENTVFSYAVLLSLYLLGTAVGAAFYQVRLVGSTFAPTLTRLLIVQAMACTAGMWILNFSADIYAWLGLAGKRPAEVGVAVAVFLVPTLVMGALFSHLAQAAQRHRRQLGAALAVNTLGGASAPFLFGIVLMPAWGPTAALLAICTGYLLLLPTISRKSLWPVAGCTAAAGLIFAISAPFDFNRLAPGEEVVIHHHGIMAGVTVIRDSRQDYHLKVNNHYQMGGTASRYSDRRQAHIPLLLHPNPENVLFLGLGTGTTFDTAGQYEGLQADGVELIPEVIPLMRYFQSSAVETGDRKSLHIFAADARRFVLARQQQYDVIVADLFHPSRDGAGFLYTKEHFNAVRGRLSENGIFCQWLPLYQMDLDLMRLIVRTFLDVFPEGSAFIAHHSLTQPIIGLVGGRQAIQVAPDTVSRRVMSRPLLAGQLRSVGLSNIYTLLGCYLADGRQLRQFAGPGPLNTDDQPRALFQAPDFVYCSAPSSVAAADRILAIVEAFTPQAETILATTAADSEKTRLAAYWQARNAYLRTGANASPTYDLKSMLDQVAEPLLDIVRTSPDFEAAYQPLLRMAAQLHRQDPQESENLLTALEAATPQRPEAGRMKLKLSKGI